MISRFVRPHSSVHTAAGSLVQPIVSSTHQKVACLPNTKYNWLHTKYNNEGCYVTAVRWEEDVNRNHKTENGKSDLSPLEQKNNIFSITFLCLFVFLFVFFYEPLF